MKSIFSHANVKTALDDARAVQEKQKEKNRTSNLKNMREMVINEIMTTERNYVADLEDSIFVSCMGYV